jgi:hypothetical protein
VHVAIGGALQFYHFSSLLFRDFFFGEQNPHGVKLIYGTDRRFVMTAWMTANPDFVE